MPDPDVTATPSAVAMVRRLVEIHGPLAIFQSGGCCDGSTPICVRAEELPLGPHDLLLGEIAGVPVYVDDDQHRRWRQPHYTIDVSPGAPTGMSIGLDDQHLTSRPAAPTPNGSAEQLPPQRIRRLAVFLPVERAQRVEDHSQVDSLLQQRARDRRQVAQGGDEHRREAETHAAQHALPGDVKRTPAGV